MRVKCKKIFTNRPNRKERGNKTEHLEIDKEYIVLSTIMVSDSILYLQLESDAGDLIMFEADQFDILTTYIPSNWGVLIKPLAQENLNTTYYLALSPNNWNNTTYDFLDEILDISGPLESHRDDYPISEVMKLYFQEKDLIYREEEEYSLKQLQQK